jgi:hypothetical protein
VLVVDATKLSITPGVGLVLRSGKDEYRGPTLWFSQRKALAKDGRLRGQRREIRARKLNRGGLELADSDLDLTSLRAHSTLVVVLWTPGKKTGSP